MATKVRAKFVVLKKEEVSEGYNLELMAVTGGSAENESFFRYTPAGQLKMWTVNPDAAAPFEAGKECYVEFLFGE